MRPEDALRHRPRRPRLAGLDGIARELDPGPAFAGDIYAAENLRRVPRTLHEALAGLEKSAFTRSAFGDPVIGHLLHFAHTEQEVFDTRVSDVQRERYFEGI
jgi:glutamine synthetase